MKVTYEAIGVIHSPFREQADTPIQGTFSEAEGTVEVFPEYAAGLKDIGGFSHLFLIYDFHRATGYSLVAKPFLDGSEERGIFAIRHFRRPNPIGLSIVELRKVRGNILEIRGVDVLDGTPLLDIKPYIRQFDCREAARSGWAEGKGQATDRPDQYTPRKLAKK
ncbi:MAG TPA: tRNA (N6-threonylcarbamoyladenosine(37)-N6)-methyltransferase TrmO [Methanocella sp.]|nr:tRNA (N6-threonylcarbamoyladenosine(37)-N6)-methyltransferase TrmO [Methanocella sp.]